MVVLVTKRKAEIKQFITPKEKENHPLLLVIKNCKNYRDWYIWLDGSYLHKDGTEQPNATPNGYYGTQEEAIQIAKKYGYRV